MWEAWQAERPRLAPLPILPLPFDLVATRRVGADALVAFEGRQYSVPFAYLGREVEIRGGAGRVQVLADAAVIAEHARHTPARLVIDPTHYDGPGTPRVAAPTPLGLVSIEATPGGPDGSVAVVLTLQRPAGPPEIPPAWPLTPQEREVVRLLLRGDSNRAISASLFVSENTVQTHLRNIYGKLEVSGRTQLLARLFRESAGRELLEG